MLGVTEAFVSIFWGEVPLRLSVACIFRRLSWQDGGQLLIVHEVPSLLRYACRSAMNY